MLRKQRFIHSVIARTTPSRHPPNCNSPTNHDVSTGLSFIRNVFIQSNRSLTDHSSPFLSGRGAGGRSRLFQTTQIQNVLHMGIHFLYSLKSCFCFVKLRSVKIHELIKLSDLSENFKNARQHQSNAAARIRSETTADTYSPRAWG